MDCPQLQVIRKALWLDLLSNMTQCWSQRTASKAEIGGQAQKQPLDKGWKHPCKQHKSRELCTPGTGERLHSAVAGDKFPTTHTTASFPGRNSTWFLTAVYTEQNMACHPPASSRLGDFRVYSSPTLPLLCWPVLWSSICSSEFSCPKEFPDFSQKSCRQNFFQIGSGYCKVPMPQPIRQLPTWSQEQRWAPGSDNSTWFHSLPQSYHSSPTTFTSSVFAYLAYISISLFPFFIVGKPLKPIFGVVLSNNKTGNRALNICLVAKRYTDHFHMQGSNLKKESIKWNHFSEH